MDDAITKANLFSVLVKYNKEVVTCLKAAQIVAEVDDWKTAYALMTSSKEALNATIELLEAQLDFNKED